MKPLTKKIQPFIEALYPIIYIQSYEELKIDAVVQELAKSEGKKIDEWNLSKAESLNGFLEPYILGTESFDEVFLVLKDVHGYLEKAHPEHQKIVALLKKVTLQILSDDDAFATIIIVAPVLNIPIELEKYITMVEVDLPDSQEINLLIQQYLDGYEQELDAEELGLLSNHLKGLSAHEINMILNLNMQKNGDIGYESSRSLIAEEKKQIIRKSGLLEMVEPRESIEDIGGLDNLKDWLQKKSKIFLNIEEAEKYGVDTPKGVFIVGMPGCGKSLTAKATALLFNNIPLLRLDIGRLMGKYVGESESNMRKAIEQAEAISPCILWIDEIEKAFTGIKQGGSGSEVATRLFGTFLTWMQEKKTPVYVVATANDISNLPPELLRKGRFDELFFVDFPNEEERRQIFKVHIKNRKQGSQHVDDVDFTSLSSETEGYSGADIETVVKETIEEGFVADTEVLQTQDYLEVIAGITSISEMLPKQVKIYREKQKEMKIKMASKS